VTAWRTESRSSGGEPEMPAFKPGAHCRLDYVTEAQWRTLPPELRARLCGALGEPPLGHRLVNVVKQLRAKREGDLAAELVRYLRPSETGRAPRRGEVGTLL